MGYKFTGIQTLMMIVSAWAAQRLAAELAPINPKTLLVPLWKALAI